MNNKQSPFPVIVGFIIIALSFFFLAGIMAKFDSAAIMQKYWPLLFVLLGLGLISSPGRNKLAAFGLIIFGALLIMERSGVFASSNGRFFLVLLLGLLGLVILVLYSSRRHPDEQEISKKITEAEYQQAKRILSEYDKQ